MGHKERRFEPTDAAKGRGRTLLRTFQRKLERLRLEADLTHGAFAKRLGLPRSSYFHLLTDAANPSLDYVELIAERAGIEPLALLHTEPDEPASVGYFQVRPMRVCPKSRS
jgi:transcriptional regulator with XRE-family HTH domain